MQAGREALSRFSLFFSPNEHPFLPNFGWFCEGIMWCWLDDAVAAATAAATLLLLDPRDADEVLLSADGVGLAVRLRSWNGTREREGTAN